MTLGRSRVREIRPPRSVRAKPNGIATRPSPRLRFGSMTAFVGFVESTTQRSSLAFRCMSVKSLI
ncbi:hypothetical protein DA102_033745 [Sinorhizobium meliloti]|nr:hypothetical protein DA102_033745 [Sinorhizobium meliloti]